MTADIERVLVVGAGTMGRGVAKSFAESGFETLVWSRRGADVPGLAPGVRASAALPSAVPDLVIENVPEEIAVKEAVYQALEAAYPPATIIATNTSGLPLDELARGLAHPERFLGAHYFQPADVFPMVEVIAGTRTAAEAVARTADAMRRTGKEPILVRKPVEGYLINRIQHALLNEAYHLIEIGAATAKEIDDIAKRLLGPRMCITGVIEQKDLSGLKIHAAAQTALVPKLAHSGKPAAFVQDLAARGETGAEAGLGFYDWRACDAAAAASQARERLKRLLDFLAHELAPERPGTRPKPRELGG